MKLAVFGSTGKTGLLLVEQALEEGHEVVAFARNPEKMTLSSDRLSVFEGDALDPEAVQKAVEGADAVISLLGVAPKSAELTFTRGLGNIIAAMKQHAVKRLIQSAGAGVGDPQDQPGFTDKLFGLIIKLVARSAYEDGKQAAARLREVADLDWTLVRVPMLTDDPANGEIRSGYLGKGVGPRLSRADMAAFMLEQLTDQLYIKEAPVISN